MFQIADKTVNYLAAERNKLMKIFVIRGLT